MTRRTLWLILAPFALLPLLLFGLWLWTDQGPAIWLNGLIALCS